MRCASTLLLVGLLGACGPAASKTSETAQASPTQFVFVPRFECDARYACEAFVENDGHLRTVMAFAHGADGRCYGMNGRVVIDEAASELRWTSNGKTAGTVSSTSTLIGPEMRCVKEE